MGAGRENLDYAAGNSVSTDINVLHSGDLLSMHCITKILLFAERIDIFANKLAYFNNQIDFI